MISEQQGGCGSDQGGHKKARCDFNAGGRHPIYWSSPRDHCIAWRQGTPFQAMEIQESSESSALFFGTGWTGIIAHFGGIKQCKKCQFWMRFLTIVHVAYNNTWCSLMFHVTIVKFSCKKWGEGAWVSNVKWSASVRLGGKNHGVFCILKRQPEVNLLPCNKALNCWMIHQCISIWWFASATCEIPSWFLDSFWAPLRS